MLFPGYRVSFFLLIIGQFLSVLGSGISTFTIVWWLTAKYNSGTLIAIQLIASMLPGILLGPFLAPIVDRLPRQKIMLVCDLLNAVLLVPIIAAFALEKINIPLLVLFAVLSSVLAAVHQPTLLSACSQIITPEGRGKLAGIREFMHASKSVFGPIIATLLFNWFAVSQILGVQLLTFIISFVSLFFVKLPPLLDREKQGLWKANDDYKQDLIEAWHFMRRNRSLSILLVFFMLVNIGITLPSILPLLVTQVFHAGPGVLAGLETAYGIGWIVSSIAVTATGGFSQRVQALLIGMPACGLCRASLGLSPTVGLAMGFTFLYGVVGPAVNASSTSIWLEWVPERLQGRIFSIRNSLGQFGTTIGYLFGGILADRYGASLILVGGGVLVVAVTILVILESSLFSLEQSSLSREGLAE